MFFTLPLRIFKYVIDFSLRPERIVSTCVKWASDDPFKKKQQLYNIDCNSEVKIVIWTQIVIHILNPDYDSHSICYEYAILEPDCNLYSTSILQLKFILL